MGRFQCTAINMNTLNTCRPHSQAVMSIVVISQQNSGIRSTLFSCCVYIFLLHIIQPVSSLILCTELSLTIHLGGWNKNKEAHWNIHHADPMKGQIAIISQSYVGSLWSLLDWNDNWNSKTVVREGESQRYDGDGWGRGCWNMSVCIFKAVFQLHKKKTVTGKRIRLPTNSWPITGRLLE